MNYNLLVIISIVICAIISLEISYYATIIILEENSSLFKIAQLIIAVILLSTLYAPIKHILIKYMNINEFEDEKKDD